MIKNFIIIAIRNFKRNKFFSFLNIFGLSIGIATAILSLLYVSYEVSFDRFNANADRTYRIAVDALMGNTVIQQTYTPAPMPAALYTEFPEIEAVCRISGPGSATKVAVGDQIFKESNILATDTTFFKIFSAQFVSGETGPSNLAANRAVITEKIAQKYFGDQNPVGRILVMDDRYNIEVAAVIKEFPQNAHFHFDMLVSLLSLEGFYNNTQWFNNNFKTYILLQPNQDYKNLEAKLPAFVDKYLFEGHYAERSKDGNKWELYLQPLTDIHLHSHLSGEFEPNGNAAYVYIFGVVAVFILLIACINFVNLATARSATRAKEIGIRKVVGSGRTELIGQFLSESLITSFISLGLAVLFVEAAQIYMPALIGTSIPVSTVFKFKVLPLLLGVAVIVGLFSGIYPALVLSSFKPASVLKAQFLKGGGNSWSRNILVIFQFVISIILIIGTIVISRQLHFIQNEQLGFDKDQVVVIKNANMITNQLDVFKNNLTQIPAVQSVSVSTRLPGIRFNNIGFGAEGFEDGYTLNICMADENFQNVLKFNMIKGRFFAKEFTSDSSAVVINEAAVKLLDWDDPIGKKIHNWGNPMRYFNVVGVVEDLHYESMHTEVRPMGFFQMNSTWHWTPRYISVRLNTNNIAESVKKMEAAWNGLNSALPFEFSFFDKDYESLYQNEMQTRNLFVTFSLLAIFIACLGLFGLAAFMIEQRTREIGIRKVLGASVPGLLGLLSTQFTKWVLIANLVAWPVAWYVMNRWLENFAYRIEIVWWFYLIAGGLALLIALITVFSQAVRAALANPVESLRYE